MTSTKNRNEITLDLETTPTVDEAVKAKIAEGITHPSNMSKADTIAAWAAEKKPALVHEAILKTSFDGAAGHICVIGAAMNDDEPVTFWKPGTEPHLHEAEILKEFFYFLKDAYSPSCEMRPLFIGHNIVNFDLLFLRQRAIILGIAPPAIIPFGEPAWSDRIHDNMLAFAGLRGSISQDKLSKALGQPGKAGMDGSKVWGAVCEGRIAEVAEYCADDVRQARANYKRITFQTLPAAA